MKRYLILVAIFAITLPGLIGCNGDNGTTSQIQPPSQPQNNAIDPEIPNPPDDESAVPETPTTPVNNTGICYANNFVGERFRVVSYANNIIEASIDITNCRLVNDRLKGEVRRPHVRGIREFVGDARGIHGNRIRIYTGSLPRSCRPKKDELLTMIWKARRRI